MMSNNSRIEQLSVLCPETVIGIEGVPFATRAEALPGVVEAHYSINDVPSIGENSDDLLDVSEQMRLSPDSEERMIVMDRHIVVGGLCIDHDGSSCDPLEEGCANGHIFHRGSRARREEESSFYEAIGFDGDGNKELRAEVVSAELAQRVSASIRENIPLWATLCNLLRSQVGLEAVSWNGVLEGISQAVHQEGWEYALDYVAEHFLGVRWWCDVSESWRDKLSPLVDMLCESEAEAAWEQAVSSGKLGNSLAVMLDIYEHGGVSYSLSGHGMQCGWDTTRGGAVWVPDKDAEENIRLNVLQQLDIGTVRWFGALGSTNDPLYAAYSLDGGLTWEGRFPNFHQAMHAMVSASGKLIDPSTLNRLMQSEARQYAKGIVEEYQEWVNGEVYGVVVYVIDRKTGERIDDLDDECWGHIGHEYAEKTLEGNILNTVLHLQKPLN
ncbi:MAG: hypothetical protein K8H75_04105 [Sulfuricella sp.]|nr:hypothetical protein [Sulfuricella sp.]